MNKPDYQDKIQKRLDQAAIVFSGLCTIHCLLAPILFVIFPVWGATFVTDEKFHQLLLWLVLPVSLLALLLGYSQRRDKVTLLLGLVGLSQLIIAVMLGNEFFSELSEVVITPLAGLILITGHIRNYQLCRCDECKA